jgi:NAD+ dependent glucose-6-phosphate dehydrogenase
MSLTKTVLITGASGNLGAKLRQHLHRLYSLRLLDLDPRGGDEIILADLSRWNQAWIDQFIGVDVVIHLAGNPLAHQTWPNVIGPNIDATIHVFEAAAAAGVRRVIFASSNHVMGGYKDDPSATSIKPYTAPRPGTRYEVQGEQRDSTPYAAAKLFGERLGKCYADTRGLSVIAVRIGWVRPGDNLPQDVPLERGPWFRLMWLSNRDFCQIIECCILAENLPPFVILNAMSANTGMRWDIAPTRELVGYEPQDDVTNPAKSTHSKM